jgi:hypothetical protein
MGSGWLLFSCTRPAAPPGTERDYKEPANPSTEFESRPLFSRPWARIGLPELLVGVPFPVAALEVVRFAVPRDKLQALLYTGRTLPPPEALAAGLIDEVVAAGQLLVRADTIARQLALIPPSVYRLTKQSLRAEALDRMEQELTRDRRTTRRWTCGRRLKRTSTSANICAGRSASSCRRFVPNAVLSPIKRQRWKGECERTAFRPDRSGTGWTKGDV